MAASDLSQSIVLVVSFLENPPRAADALGQMASMWQDGLLLRRPVCQ